MAIGNGSGDEVKTCVVLGGRGFIGRCLVLRLLKLGKWIVRIADSDPVFEPDPFDSDLLTDALSSGRASYFHVDVRNKAHIIRAIEGASVVFFLDLKESYTQDFYFCYTGIVQGAKNVIIACRECKVKKLIYNSSADVVCESGRDINEGDESLFYANKFENMLIDLKAQAEALILLSNDIDGLVTCALRPSNVFGPGDRQLVPLLVNTAKSGWTKFIIGSGDNMADFTYVENVVHAHICAEEALGSRLVAVSGKVFFITNLEPVKFREFVSVILENMGYERPVINLPLTVARYMFYLLKLLHRKMDYPSIHRFLELSSHTRTFKTTAAQKHLEYSPLVSLEEGIELTVESFPHIAQQSSLTRCYDVDGESKVDKLLGSGKVADVLLWKDEKKTFTCFLSLVLMYYWFFLSGRTFMSSISKLLLLITVLLSGYRILPVTVFSFTIPRLSLFSFEISEADMRTSVSDMASIWNKACQLSRQLAQGEDWYTFIKVAAVLYFLKVTLPNFFTVVVGVALVLAFTLFFIYEQYEDLIDGVVDGLFCRAREAMGFVMRKLPMPLASSFKEKGYSTSTNTH